jgi:hypothetical protein
MTYELHFCHVSNQYGCFACEYFNDCLISKVTIYRKLSFNVFINKPIC